jgi:hypothetical protein
MPLEWKYGESMSGIPFTLTTASGTLAIGYSAAQLSGVWSKDGGAWAALGSRISGIPGDGVYTLASLSSTEMTCNTWALKVSANSGCLPQVMIGYNRSGLPSVNDVSGLAAILSNVSSIGANISGKALKTDVSALAGILVAISGLKVDVSGLAHATDVSALLNVASVTDMCSGVWGYSGVASSRFVTGGANIQAGAATVDNSAIANQVWLWSDNSTSGRYITGGGGGSASVDISSIALQTWNTVRTIATSATTFGGYINVSGGFVNVSGLDLLATLTSVSGNNNLLSAISGLKNDVSGLPGIMTQISSLSVSISGHALKTDVSAIAGILAATSGLKNDVSGLPGILTQISSLSVTTSGLSLKTDVSALAGILAATSGLKNDVSGLPSMFTQISSLSVSISGMAHSLDASGLDNIYTTLNNRTSGIPGIATSISGLNTSNLVAQCSSILAGVSGVPSGVSVIPTTGATSLASGTLAHDLRLLRRQAWGNLNIDKTYTPIRLYLQGDDGNMSSYFTLTDDANNTIRTKV